MPHKLSIKVITRLSISVVPEYLSLYSTSKSPASFFGGSWRRTASGISGVDVIFWFITQFLDIFFLFSIRFDLYHINFTTKYWNQLILNYFKCITFVRQFGAWLQLFKFINVTNTLWFDRIVQETSNFFSIANKESLWFSHDLDFRVLSDIFHILRDLLRLEYLIFMMNNFSNEN